MRTGLVVAGLAIAVVGGGLIGSLFFLPQGPAHAYTDVVTISADLAQGSTRTWAINDTPATGSLHLSWSASGEAAVSLALPVTCPSGMGICSGTPPIAAWPGNASGRWTMTGPISASYLLSVTNPGASTLAFTGFFSESYSPGSGSSLPITTVALVATGGLILLIIGATALFLGLFLRAGVYTTPASHPLGRRETAVSQEDPEAGPPDGDEQP